MPAPSSTPVLEPVEAEQTRSAPDRPWVTLVWDDPVNLMSYVTLVFQKVLGHSRAKAHALMMDVHTKGRAVVASGPRETMERHVAALQEAGLWATMSQD